MGREWLLAIAALCLASCLTTAAAQDAPPGTPSAAERTLSFDAKEGTWMALDVSRDGRTILFDLLGDIYALDTKGGAARPVLRGPAFEMQPVFSPDGRQFAFISDRAGSDDLTIANADGTPPRALSHEPGPRIS